MRVKTIIKYGIIVLLGVGLLLYVIDYNRKTRDYNKKDEMMRHVEDFYEDFPIIDFTTPNQ